MNAREQLTSILERMTAARDAQDELAPRSPEWYAASDAIEAVYVDLRAWNQAHA